jgi:hypothetical protein
MSDSAAVRHSNGRFVKGHPGDPGRPRNPVSSAAQDLDRAGVEVAQELLRVIVERARTGNLKAAEMVLQRASGRSAATVPSSSRLPSATAPCPTC